MITEQDPRYPIGKFRPTSFPDAAERKVYIETFAAVPQLLRNAVEHLDDVKLDTPYREGGWTVRQLVHHFADSHMNAYIRFRLALTEDNPVIRPYQENRWAELHDEKHGDINVSLALTENIHARMVMMFRAMTEQEWKRTFFHPEKKSSTDLATTLAMYVWHSNHHLAHINKLREQSGW